MDGKKEKRLEVWRDNLAKNTESIKALRNFILKEVPWSQTSGGCDNQTLDLCMTDLVRVYLNWKDRFIYPRERQVLVWDGFWKKNNPKDFSHEINAIISASLRGDSLDSFLSEKVFQMKVKLDEENTGKISWKNKDMALSAFEVHHFHLNPRANKKRRGQSQELLYAQVSRTHILLLMLGDHNSFDDGTLYQAVGEYAIIIGHDIKGISGVSNKVSCLQGQRLARRGVNSIVEFKGKYAIPANISSAGTSMAYTRFADVCCETLKEYAPLLTDNGQLSEKLRIDISCLPASPQWSWCFEHCDLVLFDTITMTGFRIVEWKR